MKHRDIRDICDAALHLTGGSRWAWWAAFVGLALNVSSTELFCSFSVEADLAYRTGLSWDCTSTPELRPFRRSEAESESPNP